jgi:RES domain
MYGSQDLQVCIHECRVTAEDDLYVATLAPTRELRLLDLTELLLEDKVTEFENLDMAVHMLFLAGEHSYEIAREIAREAHGAGYDGLVYPSYFSLLRTGGTPFETSYGISHRRFPHLANREKAKIIRNLALFGRPIEQSAVALRCINRLILTQVGYGIQFGPVGC